MKNQMTLKSLLLSLVTLSLSCFTMACEDNLDSSPPGYIISDNASRFLQNVSGTYVTDSVVNFHFDNLEGSDEQLRIVSSNEALLKPVDFIPPQAISFEGFPCLSENESECQETEPEAEAEQPTETNGVYQSFEVLGTGSVTLTFYDGERAVESRQVALVNAQLVIKHNIYHSIKNIQEKPELENGDKFFIGRQQQVRVNPVSTAGDRYFVGSLLEDPVLENATLNSSFSPYGYPGVNIDFTPNQVGPMSFQIKLAGQTQTLNFEAVAYEDVADIEVKIIVDAEPTVVERDGVETEVLFATAVMWPKHADGQIIYGGQGTWIEDSPLSNGHSYTGTSVRFEYSEGDSTRFNVAIGNAEVQVSLPMAEGTDFTTGTDGLNGCDAQGVAQNSGMLLFSLMLALALIIRQQKTDLL